MSTEPVSIIGFEAFERRTIKLRVPFDNLKNLCFSALGKALRAGARLPEAALKTDHPQPSARELETLYQTLAEGLICSKERSGLPRQRSSKLDQPITIINADALNKICVTLERLKNLCSPALAKALLAGARSPEAVLKTDYPQPSAQEVETLYRTLSEGLICSKERSELPRQQANLEKPDQTITIINADALDKLRVSFDRLKDLCSPTLAKALAAGARLAGYKTLAEGLQRSELLRQQANLEKPDQTITIINADALDKLRVVIDRLKSFCSPVSVKALAVGARLR